MTLTNTSDFPNYTIRRAVAYCCRIIGIKVKRIRYLTVRLRRHGGHHSGHWYECGKITITTPMIGSRYVACKPSHKWQRFPEGTSHTAITRLLEFVSVLAHEIGHETDYQERRAAGKQWRDAEHTARWFEAKVIEQFVTEIDELLIDWFKPPQRPAAAPKPSRSERTLERNRAAVERWERKLTLAKTKLAKYRRAVAAGERYTAARRSIQSREQ